jgi:hypothetical protein
MKWKLLNDEPSEDANILTMMANIRTAVSANSRPGQIFLDLLDPRTDLARIMQVGGHFIGTVTGFSGGPAGKYAICHLANSGKIPPIGFIASNASLPVSSEEVKQALAMSEQQLTDFQNIKN